LEKIGEGKYSTVYKCISKKDKVSRALKILDKSKLNPEDKDLIR